ncbi:MAG: mercury methylation corrinoid protein HgcA [Candidatus Margulisbacteria bacterium]|nr:mercury methylation corrinoid protein HgcA [Candidatus Margulisiibacteriota bacterium]
MSITRVSSTLTFADRWGSFKVRWGIGRSDYSIEPGLYALGKPSATSPVIVTANYKLTFDIVRSNLFSLSIYILVLDTKGVNVWCAAGKGTFGTEELIARILATELSTVVSHRTIILPQLGAVGVAAHDIQKTTGFKVVYGPVRIEDMPAFLQNEMKATPEMREVRFTLKDRLILVPVELVNYVLPALGMIIFLLLISLIHINGLFLSFNEARSVMQNIALAYIGGVVITPVLLPWIPARSFSAKGAIIGFLLALLFQLFTTPWLFIIPAISSFLAMNFTGSSTYTSLSGVKKEMRIAVPLQLTAMILGIIWIVLTNIIK